MKYILTFLFFICGVSYAKEGTKEFDPVKLYSSELVSSKVVSDEHSVERIVNSVRQGLNSINLKCAVNEIERSQLNKPVEEYYESSNLAGKSKYFKFINRVTIEVYANGEKVYLLQGGSDEGREHYPALVEKQWIYVTVEGDPEAQREVMDSVMIRSFKGYETVVPDKSFQDDQFVEEFVPHSMTEFYCRGLVFEGKNHNQSKP